MSFLKHLANIIIAGFVLVTNQLQLEASAEKTPESMMGIRKEEKPVQDQKISKEKLDRIALWEHISELVSQPYSNSGTRKAGRIVKATKSDWTWKTAKVNWHAGIASLHSSNNVVFYNTKSYLYTFPPSQEDHLTVQYSTLFPSFNLNNLTHASTNAEADRNAALITIKPGADISFKTHVHGKKGDDMQQPVIHGIAFVGASGHSFSKEGFDFVEPKKQYFNFSENTMLALYETSFEGGRLPLMVSLRSGITLDSLSQEDKKNLRDEAIAALSQTYKIHVQIKKEYLLSFMQDFTSFIVSDKYGRLIEKVKCPVDYKGKCIDGNLATIIAYLPFLPGAIEKRNIILQNLCSAIIERYEDYFDENDTTKQIALFNEQGTIKTPRFSRQIKGFLFLAQGDGDTKKVVEKLLNLPEAKIYYHNPYSEDMAFFVGFEPSLKVWKKVSLRGKED